MMMTEVTDEKKVTGKQIAAMVGVLIIFGVVAIGVPLMTAPNYATGHCPEAIERDYRKTIAKAEPAITLARAVEQQPLDRADDISVLKFNKERKRVEGINHTLQSAESDVGYVLMDTQKPEEGPRGFRYLETHEPACMRQLRDYRRRILQARVDMMCQFHGKEGKDCFRPRDYYD